MGTFTLAACVIVCVCVQIQKKRSKDASKQVDLTATDALREQLRHIKATQFRGYEEVAGAGLVVAILRNGELVSTAHQGHILTVAACLMASHPSIAGRVQYI